MLIRPADLSAPDLLDMLRLHLMEAADQDCSSAFPIERLAGPDMSFFEARDADGSLMGCAGLKRLSETEGEIKSVRTHPDHLRKGVAAKLMEHVADHAREAGLKRLSLETHPTPAYAAARKLYERLGYAYCGPFGDYSNMETSVYMTREL